MVDDYFRLTVIAIQAEDGEFYRAICRHLLARLADPTRKKPSPQLVSFIAWVGSVAPGGVDDPEALVQLAGPAARDVRGDDEAAFARVALGAALYRAGRPADAIQTLATIPDTTDPVVTIESKILLGMAHHQLGHHDDARRLLKEVALDKPTGDPIADSLRRTLLKEPGSLSTSDAGSVPPSPFR